MPAHYIPAVRSALASRPAERNARRPDGVEHTLDDRRPHGPAERLETLPGLESDPAPPRRMLIIVNPYATTVSTG